MIKPTPDITSPMSFVAKHHPFDESHYPGFDALTPAQQHIFAVRHSCLHMSKTLGRIAAEAESADHGGIMNNEKLKVATTKMIINVLILVDQLGMMPEDLSINVPQVMKIT